jgi:hypothetical protein
MVIHPENKIRCIKDKALIVDLDGTLADIRFRLVDLDCHRKDWKSFNKTIESDPLHQWCREVIHRFVLDHKIIIVSGRMDE